jgi:hypothetical protein
MELISTCAGIYCFIVLDTSEQHLCKQFVLALEHMHIALHMIGTAYKTVYMLHAYYNTYYINILPGLGGSCSATSPKNTRLLLGHDSVVNTCPCGNSVADNSNIAHAITR